MPPEIDNPEFECRSLAVELSAAKRESDDRPTIVGLAAVYNQEAKISWFREVIRPGAFDRVLAENPDTVAAWNHNWDIILGRTTSNTLHLEDTPAGLRYIVDINPDDPEAMSKYAKVARGDIHQSSFYFTVLRDDWTYPEDETQLPLRAITEIGILYEVSPVTFPAYVKTSAAVRSKQDEWNQILSNRSQAAKAGGGNEQQPQERLSLLRKCLDLADRS